MSDEKLDLLLEKTTRIETALWPDYGQPSILTKHTERMDDIEDKIAELNTWKNRLIGAWAVVTSLFGIHTIRHGG
jgi:hypothetical protein